MKNPLHYFKNLKFRSSSVALCVFNLIQQEKPNQIMKGDRSERVEMTPNVAPWNAQP